MQSEDTSMMLHAAATMKCRHHRILIHTVDTDVLVLAIWVAHELHEVVDELRLALGKGKNFCIILSTRACCMPGTRKVEVTSSASCIHWMQYGFSFYRTWKENGMGS